MASTFTVGGVISTGSNGTTTGLTKAGAGTLVLQGANDYTGKTTVSAGTLTLSGGSGALALSSSPLTLLGGVFNIGDGSGTAATNNNERVANTQTVTLSSGSLVLKGTAITSTDTTESIGAVTQVGGTGNIKVTFGGTRKAELTLASLSHTAGAAATLVNGTSLGKDTASTTSVGRLFLTSTPTLVGTTAAAATGINSTNKDTVIVPYLVGEATTTTGGLGTQTGTANTFVTYNTTTGLRPLNPTDEFSTVGTAVALVSGNNNRLTTALSAGAADVSINSLVINSTSGSALPILNGATVTVTSGAVLFNSNGGTIKPTTSTGILAFGSAEAMITTISGVTGNITANTSGSGGLTKSGAGTLVLSGTNTLTGGVSINAGTVQLGASAVNALNSTAGSQNAVSFPAYSSGTLSLNGNSVTIGNLTSDTTNPGTALVQNANAGGATLTVGNSNNLNGTYAGIIQNGTGGGTLGLTKLGAGTLTLTNTNTYTGATTVSAGTLLVNGSLSATTSVAVNDTATLGGSGGTIGTNATTVNVNAGGKIAPGASIGTLNVGTATGNTVNFVGSGVSKAVLSIELNAPNNSSDLLFINGNLNLGADDQLTLSLLNGGTATGS